MKSNKAVATPEYIGDVMNGRRDLIPLRDQPDTTLPLALWVDGNDKPTCHLMITECWWDGEGWTVRVRPWVYEQPALLLRSGSPLTGGGKARLLSGRKRKFRKIKATPPDSRKWTDTAERGYTENSSLALLDAGEAVDPDSQDAFTLAAIGRDAKRRRRQSIAAQRDRELLTVLERIENARAAAAGNYIDIREEIKAVRHMQRLGRPEQVILAELRRVEQIAHRDYRDAA